MLQTCLRKETDLIIDYLFILQSDKISYTLDILNMIKLTEKQQSQMLIKLKDYRKRFLVKKYENLDESATRLMINHFLTEILDFTQLDDIKTEYAIKGTYADYVIQLEKNKHMVVEVKAIQVDVNEQHLRQSLNYAANEGINWVLLTNGRQFILHRVIFNKPISSKEIFSINLLDSNELKNATAYFSLITKRSFEIKAHEKYWMKFQYLEATNVAKLLYAPEIIKVIRKKLKDKSGITFTDNDLVDAIYKVIVLSIPSTKPKSLIPINKKEKKIIDNEIN